MPASVNHPLARRGFLAGAAAATGMLVLPRSVRAQAGGEVQRLLVLASQSAFAQLTAPEGFWNSRVARFGLPVLFRKTPANAAGPLGNNTFREQLQRRLNNLAGIGALGAAPAVAEAARKLVVLDSAGILRGGRASAATSQLRLEMSSGLVNAMIPTIEQALIAAQDPVIAQAVTALAGVAMRDVAHAVALAADNGIWYEIGRAEAAIRANPQATNDPALVAALRPAPPMPAPAAPVTSPAS